MKPRSQNSKRRPAIRLGLVLLALAMAAGIVAYFYRPAPPDPPSMDLAGFDPAIVKVLGDARAGVLRSPRSAVAWGTLGKAFWVYKFEKQAAICFAQAEQLDPKEPRWPYFHGLSLFPAETDQGILKLQRAVELFGDTVAAPRLRLAQILAERGRLDEADHHFQRLLQRKPDQPHALLGLAKVAFARSQFEKSLEYVNRCLTNSSTARSSHVLAATIFQRLGNPEAAAQAAQRAARLPNDPSFSDPFIDEASQLRTGKKAWLDHAQQLIRQGHVVEAEPLVARTVREYPDFADAWIALGGIRVRQRDYSAAEEALRKAVQLAPRSLEAQAQLGVALLNLNRAEEAANYFRQAIEIQPSVGGTHFNLGLCLTQLGRDQEAIESFRNAIRYKPDLTDAYIGLANALVRAGQAGEAVPHLRQALQLNPSDARAHKLLEQISALR